MAKYVFWESHGRHGPKVQVYCENVTFFGKKTDGIDIEIYLKIYLYI